MIPKTTVMFVHGLTRIRSVGRVLPPLVSIARVPHAMARVLKTQKNACLALGLPARQENGGVENNAPQMIISLLPQKIQNPVAVVDGHSLAALAPSRVAPSALARTNTTLNLVVMSAPGLIAQWEPIKRARDVLALATMTARPVKCVAGAALRVAVWATINPVRAVQVKAKMTRNLVPLAHPQPGKNVEKALFAPVNAMVLGLKILRHVVSAPLVHLVIDGVSHAMAQAIPMPLALLVLGPSVSPARTVNSALECPTRIPKLVMGYLLALSLVLLWAALLLSPSFISTLTTANKLCLVKLQTPTQPLKWQPLMLKPLLNRTSVLKVMPLYKFQESEEM
jgi:hypothetical protein